VLRAKLFKAFAIVVVLLTLFSLLYAMRIINQQVVGQAQSHVKRDLSGAWAVLKSRENEIETVMRLVAMKEIIVSACEHGDWENPDVGGRLQKVKSHFNLDFLDLVGPDGKAQLRGAPPFARGDFIGNNQIVAAALRGTEASGMVLLGPQELAKEADGLRERAFMEIEKVPRARQTPMPFEERGLVLAAAVPVTKGLQLLGVVYGGILLNRNFAIVDEIMNVVYHGDTNGQLGTATIFLGDCRIATTVRLANGNRAIATRASKEVADRVLDNGMSWMGDAFVVKDRYLTAYDPIKDPSGQVIGMLYVGTLKKPFDDMARNVMWRFALASLVALALSLVLAYIIADRLALPIHRLVDASNRMRRGEKPPPVAVSGSCRETDALVVAFNQMVEDLTDREERLKALNRSYMETVGFVSHELKSPVGTMTNYVYLLREQKLGPLNDRQARALRAIDAAAQRLVEMVRHYLNLSRIENGQFVPVPTKVAVAEDVIKPLIEALDAEIKDNEVRIEAQVDAGVVLHADVNMVREVFENLVGNAIKYGKRGGLVRITGRHEGDRVVFSVGNDGPGIEPDRIPLLFRKFGRLDAGASKGKKGTGLGLFICKHIVEAHGGKISVSSRPGEWTEFEFSFPAWTPPVAAGVPARDPAISQTQNPA